MSIHYDTWDLEIVVEEYTLDTFEGTLKIPTWKEIDTFELEGVCRVDTEMSLNLGTKSNPTSCFLGRKKEIEGSLTINEPEYPSIDDEPVMREIKWNWSAWS